MPIRRILLGAIAVIVLLVLGGSALIWRPAIVPIAASERPSVDAQTYRRGAELAAIGDCSVCHVGDSGKPYAGGRSIPTRANAEVMTRISVRSRTTALCAPCGGGRGGSYFYYCSCINTQIK
jgi:hypothetical protein